MVEGQVELEKVFQCVTNKKNFLLSGGAGSIL
ncbi:hypothetical protein J2Z32_001058 [Paenibacillus turicensis]|uniref:Uncharacterized protein n=1 Tax=Paenibacillus turicensis TaxID=160487 RepID=A0ABS4FPH3_9BACL|nr:hypothetical protein [Paenibacillus turicensis]